MEFVSVAALVALALIGMVLLAASGTESDHPVITSLSDLVKVGFGALIALAYAAKNIVRKDDDK